MDYWKYLSKPLKETPAGITYMPNFYQNTIVMTLLFSCMYIIVPLLVKIIYNDWYYKLDKKKQEDLPSFIVCLFHHFLLVPRSWYHVINDFNNGNSNIEYAPIEVIVSPICLGYLISDTIFYAINELFAHNKFDYIVHHVCTVILALFTIFAEDGSICKFIPLLIICDTTNIFFNCAWLFRLTPEWRQSSIVKVLEMGFLGSFVLLRTFHMPVLFYAIAITKSKYLGMAKHMLLPIALMQLYWTVLVLSGSSKRFFQKKVIEKLN